MTDPVLKTFRSVTITQAEEAVTKRDVAKIDALVKEAKERFQLDIVGYIESLKAFLASDFEKVTDFADAAIHLNPQFAHAYHWKSVGLVESGKYEDAINCINRAMGNLLLMNFTGFYAVKGDSIPANGPSGRSNILLPHVRNGRPDVHVPLLCSWDPG